MDFNWQCIECGHDGVIPRGHELEAKAEKGWQEGKLDALVVSANQCPYCTEGKVRSARTRVEMQCDMGCGRSPTCEESGQECLGLADLRDALNLERSCSL